MASACVGPAVTAERHETNAERIFSYSAASDGFTYQIELFADRRWTRRDHSGSATPAGRLSRPAMRRFLRLLEAAAFSERTPTDAERRGHGAGSAVYRDFVRRREAHAALPCGSRVDDATEELPGALEQPIGSSE
jgi:hypothetical protein